MQLLYSPQISSSPFDHFFTNSVVTDFGLSNGKPKTPALYTDTGTDVIGKDADYGKKLDDEYRDKHYHRPSDEYSKDWNLEGAIEDLQLMFMVAKRISAEEKWPEWKQGSEFRDIRLKSLK